jgi:glyoxylase-like metal-dependent hydrolase (beta-lactamase superfamily II)/rhodanese-related sulfurtransferase
MKVEQIYTGCLAQGAYYIESAGEALIIDPLREVAPYIAQAERRGAKIKYILETHFHADFVSGHVDLAKQTGATIVFGPTAKTGFEAHIATDGEELQLGKIKIRVLHTPGHTMESSCYLLIDEDGKEKYLFSGDTLFIGDVGRPDLAQKAATMTQEELAGLLYDSLETKIKPLADDIIVYPAHGAGSACGKNMSKETFDTLGNQKKTNYALLAKTREQFIKEVTDGLAPPPYYFPQNVGLNKNGYESINTVIARGTQALSPVAVELLAETQDALILDTRTPSEFAAAHIPRSIFIGINGDFAPWVGTLITDIKQNIIVVAPEGRAEEVIIRLSRVGYDNTLGYLEGGIAAWQAAGKEVDSFKEVTAEEFAAYAKNTPKAEQEIFDVRKETEYLSEHVVDAKNTPLAYLNDYLAEFKDQSHTAYVHCAGGYRSAIAVSILKARGYHNFINVQGGFNAVKAAGVTCTEFVCPTTL